MLDEIKALKEEIKKSKDKEKEVPIYLEKIKNLENQIYFKSNEYS